MLIFVRMGYMWSLKKKHDRHPTIQHSFLVSDFVIRRTNDNFEIIKNRLTGRADMYSIGFDGVLRYMQEEYYDNALSIVLGEFKKVPIKMHCAIQELSHDVNTNQDVDNLVRQIKVKNK